MMIVVYNLKRDEHYVAAVQKATRETKKFGIQETHGLFGSKGWWENIRTGALPIKTTRGVISKVYMGSMNDWPEFKMMTEVGEELTWTRYVNEMDADAAYKEGATVEVDYVVQKHKPGSLAFGGTLDTKCVIEIRIESDSNKEREATR
jgi:hypothetical protein